MGFEQVYDYVVVGGGSSGCIVASRLASESKASVLLIEAGDTAEQNPETLSADGFIHAFANDNVMWDRLSDKQSSCANRRLYMGSGTGMGGSGSVNGMVYTRGDKRDFDEWPKGWKWQDVEPSFQKIEERLKVKPRDKTLYTETCIQAAKAAGFKHKDKLIDGALCGYLGYQTMNYDGIQRRSSYVGFIKECVLPNLEISTRSKARQILFNKSNKVSGLIYRQSGTDRYVAIKKELILCAGALETPKLLMLSGVGPKSELDKYNIPVVAESEQIGSNLQDHPNVCLFYKGKQSPDSRYPQLYGFNRANKNSDLPQDQADTCYVFYSAPASLKQSLKRMLPAVLLPSSLFFNHHLRKALRFCVDMVYAVPFINRFLSQLYGVVVILGKPKSRGKVTLRSSDPDDQLCINPDYFDSDEDLETMTAGVHLAKAITHQQPLVDWGNTGLVTAARTNDDRKIKKWIKDATMTTFHYCGTCAMGEDNNSPVDLKLKLNGVKGIRVADASVIPEIPVSALNAPSMMIGYRAAEFILSSQKTTDKNKSKASRKAEKVN